MSPEQRARRVAGEAAAQLVRSDTVIGLGTGDTAAYAIRAIAARCRPVAQGGDGLSGLRCVATSRRSAELAAQLGLTLVELDSVEPASDAQSAPLDLTIDGADEIDPQLQLIKGAGGALLFEKLVAQSSRRLVVIADPSKRVERIGEKRLLPVEVVTLGARHTRARILGVPGVRSAVLRATADGPYRTDGGNLIFDLQIDLSSGISASELHMRLKSLCGVIETGLFGHEAERALIGNPDGTVTVLTRPGG